MAHSIDRRLFGSALLAVALSVARRASSMEASGLDGTWGGTKDGVTGQVIVAGGAVIGYFWRDDYLETEGIKFSADGQGVTFAFHGGVATLTRTGERTATLDVREGGRITHLDLRRD